MTYRPSLITPDEVRIFFNPYLTYDDASDAYILSLIEVVESYIKHYWCDGSMPDREDWSKTAALLLVVSKLLKNQKIASKYSFKRKQKIGDYSFELTSSRELSPSQEFENIALDILRRKKGGLYTIDVLRL